MISLTPFYKIGTHHSTRRLWYVCYVEKMSVKIFDTHALTLMFCSTPKTEEGDSMWQLLSIRAAVLRCCPAPSLLPMSIVIATLALSCCPLHSCVDEPSITSAAVAPPRLHQSLSHQPHALEVSNRVREGMVITSRRTWCFFWQWGGTARNLRQPGGGARPIPPRGVALLGGH